MSESTRKPSARLEKTIEGVIQGKSRTQAALDAGYAPSTARVDIYSLLDKPSIRARIAARIAESQVESNEVVGTLASQMRGDLADVFPESEILAKAKEAGVSHLIKKVKVTSRFIPQEDGEPIEETRTEIEMYSAQEAAKQLASILGIVKQPATNPLDVDALFTHLRSKPKYKDKSDAELRQVVAESMAEAGIEDHGKIG